MDGHERFRAWFEWYGASQQAVGDLIGCHQSYVSKLLRAERKPNLELALRISRVTTDWPEGRIAVEEWYPDEASEAAS